MSAKLLSLLETSITNSIDSVSAATYHDTIDNPYSYSEDYNIENGFLKPGDLYPEPIIEKPEAEEITDEAIIK